MEIPIPRLGTARKSTAQHC